MFCPGCQCEFRSGFTRCESCGLDLVDDPASAKQAAPKSSAAPSTAVLRMADYCGFFSLDEARNARQRLREEGIRSDIVIRDTPTDDPRAELPEEYWLRVEVDRLRAAAAMLGADATEEDERTCPDCGLSVAAGESFCPACGARFAGE